MREHGRSRLRLDFRVSTPALRRLGLRLNPLSQRTHPHRQRDRGISPSNSRSFFRSVYPTGRNSHPKALFHDRLARLVSSPIDVRQPPYMKKRPVVRTLNQVISLSEVLSSIFLARSLAVGGSFAFRVGTGFGPLLRFCLPKPRNALLL
jgi:hypothetical protein